MNKNNTSFEINIDEIKKNPSKIAEYTKKLKADCTINGKFKELEYEDKLKPIMHLFLNKHNHFSDEELYAIYKQLFLIYPDMFFEDEFEYVHRFTASDPDAPNFPAYKEFFQYGDPDVLLSVAGNPNATKFDEYRKLFIKKSEEIRCAVASNLNAPIFREYVWLIKDKNERVRNRVRFNPNARNSYPELYKEYFETD